MTSLMCSCKSAIFVPDHLDASGDVQLFRERHSGPGHEPVDSFTWDMLRNGYVTSMGEPIIHQSFDWRASQDGTK